MIAALGHDWGEREVTTPATEHQNGAAVRVCKNDPSHTQTEAFILHFTIKNKYDVFVGITLQVLLDTADGGIKYQWYHVGGGVTLQDAGVPEGWDPIPGEDTASYTVTRDDLGKNLAVGLFRDGALVGESDVMGPVVYGTVTFDSKGGSEIAPATGLVFGDLLTRPEDPVREGYTLTGWYQDEVNARIWDFNSDTITHAVLTLYAGWKDAEAWTVTFDPNGGSAVASQTVKDGEKARKPDDPTRNGYTFQGWMLDGARFDFDQTPVTGDITLTASWTASNPVGGGGGGGGGGASTYSITVKDAENGSVTSSRKTATAGANVTLTAAPKDGYQLDTLTVTDRNNSNVTLTENTDGTFGFTMPASNVTVSSAFKAVPAGGEEQPEPSEDQIDFDDVKDTDWFYPYVEYVVKHGLMNGMGDNRFGPNFPLTRAMLVTVLYRQSGSPAVTGQMPFTDVPAGQWFTDAILWGAQNDIIKGYGKGLFGPDDLLTREQMATIMRRYADFQGKDVSARADLSGYTDAEKISDWALEGMSWCCAVGLITGRTDTALVPLGNVTRAETAAILARYNEMK